VRILRVDLRRFRGFDAATIFARGHVVVMAVPGAGRSDLIEGLERVFSAESLRSRSPTELDFYNRDTSVRAEVEVVLGDLGQELEQLFLDYLELWDRERGELVYELADPRLIDRRAHDLVVRLCYRAAWDEKEDQPQHWVDYPKTSDPEGGRFDRVGRAERDLLPFAVLHGRGRALDLGVRGGFRRLVESAGGDDFLDALEQLEAQIEERAGAFSATRQVSEALERLLASVRITLGLPPEAKASEVVRFLPEGGSLSGLIRSLGAAVDLGEGWGHLPLHLSAVAL
jgi:hypothetical protein